MVKKYRKECKEKIKGSLRGSLFFSPSFAELCDKRE